MACTPAAATPPVALTVAPATPPATLIGVVTKEQPVSASRLGRIKRKPKCMAGL